MPVGGPWRPLEKVLQVSIGEAVERRLIAPGAPRRRPVRGWKRARAPMAAQSAAQPGGRRRWRDFLGFVSSLGNGKGTTKPPSTDIRYQLQFGPNRAANRCPRRDRRRRADRLW